MVPYTARHNGRTGERQPEAEKSSGDLSRDAGPRSTWKIASVLGHNQNNLGGALAELGTRSGAEQGRKLLEDALAAYRSALEV